VRIRHLYRLLTISILTLCLSACATNVYRTRTLPEWVTRVYVPMFQNQSYETGIEEIATRLVIEEFLADGRLDVVEKDDADLIVKVSLIDYNSAPDAFESEDFPENTKITTAAKVELWSPSDNQKPFVEVGTVIREQTCVSDFRRSDMVIDVDARDITLTGLARAIVREVITGVPVDRYPRQTSMLEGPPGF